MLTASDGRTFNLKYTIPSEGEERIEEGVTPDRLRILADAQGYPMSHFRASSGEDEPVKVNLNAPVVSSTGNSLRALTLVSSALSGLGGWSVVSVTEVNEDQELQVVEAKEDDDNYESKPESRKQIAEGMVWDTDDAMASVDPYGTNVYKGVQLSNSDGAANEVSVL